MQNYNNRQKTYEESLAVASVKWQPVNSPTYDVETSFVKGTIYPSLDKPFYGKGGCCK